MAINERVRRMLLSRSGGYCMRPECHRDLFHLFETGEITSVEELAHIIGQKEDGPRGSDDLPLNQRDEYHNILVLCPTCHTTVDKKETAHLFPDTLLRRWKAQHEEQITTCFGVPRFENRMQLNEAVSALLIQNRVIFETYGPFSPKCTDPLADAAVAWARAVRTQIIPNNRKILELATANSHLLSAEELAFVQKFRLHKEAIEFNHLSGDKCAEAPLFPRAIDRIFGESNA